MRRFLTLLPLLTALCVLDAHAGNGGGMDSGGTDGLFYRLKQAKEMAIEVLSIVDEERFADAPETLRLFYKTHRTELLVEAALAQVEVKPASDVFINYQGQVQRKTMVTGLQKQSAIFVSDQISATEPLEIAAFLIHEYGHHLGVPQDEDVFLDALANALVERAIRESSSLRARTAKCVTTSQLHELIKGEWIGESVTPWRDPLPIKMQFTEHGGYSDQAIGGDESFINLIPLYYGIPGTSPNKKIEIEETCNENARGTIAIAFSSGTSLLLDLKLKFSSDRRQMRLDVKHPKAQAPVVLNLRRPPSRR